MNRLSIPRVSTGFTGSCAANNARLRCSQMFMPQGLGHNRVPCPQRVTTAAVVSASCARGATAFNWNGVLRTIPETSAEKR